jgi:crossover junction endodeoxyribonuclease RusA
MITLVLPLPPSVNAAYRNVRGKGRAKTQKYRDWEADAGVYLMQQREWKSQKVNGSYELDIRLPENIKGDIDNRIKCVSDLLVSVGAVEDDKHARRVSIERHADVPELDCYVTVKAA